MCLLWLTSEILMFMISECVTFASEVICHSAAQHGRCSSIFIWGSYGGHMTLMNIEINYRADLFSRIPLTCCGEI